MPLKMVNSEKLGISAAWVRLWCVKDIWCPSLYQEGCFFPLTQYPTWCLTIRSSCSVWWLPRHRAVRYRIGTRALSDPANHILRYGQRVPGGGWHGRLDGLCLGRLFARHSSSFWRNRANLYGDEIWNCGGTFLFITALKSWKCDEKN